MPLLNNKWVAMSESQIIEDINSFYYSPLKYVMYAFPWGAKGTVLENEVGPDKWQTALLLEVERKMIEGELLQFSTVSGHGIGKSTLVSWLILWFMSTRWSLHDGQMAADTKVVVTANTKEQLNKKTWAELSKWHKFSINSHWFEYTATSLYKTGKTAKGEPLGSNWFASAVPWSKENTEAFAGTHGENVLILFDEASAVPDMIWEVADGAMTTEGAMWFVFGNPTRNTGRFAECFEQDAKNWHNTHVDSRDSKQVDLKWAQRLIDKHGIDDDVVRKRVTGKFPRQSVRQLIDYDTVKAARDIQLPPGIWESIPAVLGIDVAREGDDDTVLCVRKGKKVVRMDSYHGLKAPEVAAKAIELIREYRPDATFIDAIGIGSGSVDMIEYLGYSVISAKAGARAIDRTFLNKRAEMWFRLKDWMPGADIPDDKELVEDLIGVEYTHQETSDKIKLLPKEEMKRSPDKGDALALTFMEEVYGELTEDDMGYPVDSYEQDSSTANAVTGY